MFRGNTNNDAPPSFPNNHFMDPADMSNQPNLCGNASGSLTAAGSSILSGLSHNIKREIDEKNEGLDHFTRFQEETMFKGMWNIHQKHMASFFVDLEKAVAMKIHEKEHVLESLTQRNRELIEAVTHATSETQTWCYMARYNESVINILSANLQEAMQQLNDSISARREGVMENENAGDAASFALLNEQPSGSGPSAAKCGYCKTKEVSVLLMPCRHLCLCRECTGFVGVCPVCQMVATASFEVNLF